MPTRSTLFTTMIFKTFCHFFTNNTANDILFVQPDLLRKIHSYLELTLINLETHIYETKPKTTPTRFNKISSISKTPTLSSCCASSAAHIAKKAMPIIALLFFIFQDKKNENGANSKTKKECTVRVKQKGFSKPWDTN